jgi:signal transduction histidine kinase
VATRPGIIDCAGLPLDLVEDFIAPAMKTDPKPSQSRKTGISVVGDMSWGAHFCHFYETKDDLLDILIPYFKTGLEENEFCVWVVFDPLNEADANGALSRAVPHFDHHLAAGDMEILPHVEWYLKDGKFDLEHVIAAWKKKLAQALAKGYAGLRFNGNEAWLTEKDWKNFLNYEKGLNEVIIHQRMIVLCTYPMATCGAAELFDVARSHEFTIARRHGNWEVLETPELKQAKAAIKRLNEELEERIDERTRELATSNHDLKREIGEHKEAENKLRLSHEQLRALTARLESLREDERIRVAREIHDELGQTLTGLKMDMLWMERKLGELADSPAINSLLDRVVEATELVDSVVAAVQQIAAELRPGVLDKLGLGPALQYEGRRFQQRTGILCEVRLPETEPLFSTQQTTALFRIYQESLTNVARHAGARKAEVDLRVEAGSVILSVQDDGRGLTEADIANPESLGLMGMKERAELLGGRIIFQHNSNQRGTVVTVRIPQTGAPLQIGEPHNEGVDR